MVLLAPAVPTKVVAVAMNYLDNLPGGTSTPPEEPVIFLKPASSVIGHHHAITYPSRVRQLDFEAELAIVVRARAHNVPRQHAIDYILGYTCGNDVTARDLQRENLPLTLCKSFDTFCPVGPLIETDIDPRSLSIELRVNGVLRQSSNTANMVFNPFDLLSYISSVMTLESGDIILTGTPSGVGPLNIGDTVDVTIQGIGTLSNSVVLQSRDASRNQERPAIETIALDPHDRSESHSSTHA